MNDDTAAREAAAGLDTEMLATLRAGLRLIALQRLRDPDLADDVAQESIARVLTVVREGNCDIRNLGAFANGVARNVIADLVRSRQRDAGADAIDEAADPASLRDALSRVVSADEHAQVRAALRGLGAEDRSILHLSFFEGLGVAEVAARLGKSSLVVRKRKSRALARLRLLFLRTAAGHTDAPVTTDTQEPSGTGRDVSEVTT